MITKPKWPDPDAPGLSAFARRVRVAMRHADLSIEEVAQKISERTGETVKNQSVQYVAQKANKSGLTPHIAAICKVSFDWLERGDEALGAPSGAAADAFAVAETLSAYKPRPAAQLADHRVWLERLTTALLLGHMSNDDATLIGQLVMRVLDTAGTLR